MPQCLRVLVKFRPLEAVEYPFQVITGLTTPVGDIQDGGLHPNAMRSAAQGYTQSCLPPFTSWTLYSGISLISLGLFLAIHYIRRRGQQAYLEREPDPWSQSFDMEKAMIKSTPSPSASDILKPLSWNGTFPSSGAVAAMAREQMQKAGSGSGSPGASEAEDPTRSEAGNEASGSVQSRSESVQQIHEGDTGGVQTWRRLIVEYS